MYQEALDLEFEERGITDDDKIKEYCFKVCYKGKELSHSHKVDFFIWKTVFVECKAVDCLSSEHRQQLWNCMRLAGIKIGILYNFAPFHDQCERYYLDAEKKIIYAF